MTPFSILNSQFSIPLLLLLLCGGGAATAQTDSEAALKEIEANNTTLRALRGEVEAQKLENQTGLYLPGPEVAFDYLWGNPAPIGSRTDVRVTQSFDLPTLAGMKSRLAAGRNRLAELQYRAERMRLLLEASLLCVDMIYCNALHRLLEERLEQATALAQSCETRLKAGDISLPEHNKAMLNLSAARAGLLRAEAERQSVTAELRRMNGGMEVTVGDDRYPAVSFPPHFEDWYAEAEQQHPLLACVRQETENGRRQIGLSKAATWPVLSAGYMSEKVLGQQYQGITLGLSIPLWENRNRVRQAQAAARAAEYRQTDRRDQFRNRLQGLYLRAATLHRATEAYRTPLVDLNPSALLQKSLAAGEISLLDYLTELGYYYDTLRQALETERDFRKAFAELSATGL